MCYFSDSDNMFFVIIWVSKVLSLCVLNTVDLCALDTINLSNEVAKVQKVENQIKKTSVPVGKLGKQNVVIDLAAST